MKRQKNRQAPSEPSGGLGRGKAAELGHPYPSPDSLVRFARRFFSRDNDITIVLAVNRISALTTICFTKRLVFLDKDDKPEASPHTPYTYTKFCRTLKKPRVREVVPDVVVYLQVTITLGGIHSSLLLFITCKLHQKQSGKRTPSIVVKRSLKIPDIRYSQK